MSNGRTAGAAFAAEHSGDVTAGELVRALAAFMHDTLTLVALEGRLAAVSLIAMLAAGVVAALAIMSIWLFLLAALATTLVATGWSWASVLLCIAAANALLALLCWLVIRALSRHLLFAATRRALRPRDTRAPGV
jgi:hypothetical protein